MKKEEEIKKIRDRIAELKRLKKKHPADETLLDELIEMESQLLEENVTLYIKYDEIRIKINAMIPQYKTENTKELIVALEDAADILYGDILSNYWNELGKIAEKINKNFKEIDKIREWEMKG